jgi:hypothetical protein
MRTEYATGAAGIAATARAEMMEEQTGQANMQPDIPTKKRGRGRPKGATSSTLSEVRAQATEEKRKIREELSTRIEQLKTQLETLELESRDEIRELQEALRLSEQRENFFRAALEDRLQVVADHIHKSLVDWADAELAEGQVTRRKRGRPRKTFK